MIKVSEEGGIEILWDEARAVLRVDFHKGWDPALYFTMVRRANSFVKEQSTITNVILNFLESGLSPSINVFEMGNQTMRRLPENIDNVIAVDARRSTQLVMEAFARIFPFNIPNKKVNFRVANSLEQAYDLLGL